MVIKLKQASTYHIFAIVDEWFTADDSLNECKMIKVNTTCIMPSFLQVNVFFIVIKITLSIPQSSEILWMNFSKSFMSEIQSLFDFRFTRFTRFSIWAISSLFVSISSIYHHSISSSNLLLFEISHLK